MVKTTAFQAVDEGSIPFTPSRYVYGIKMRPVRQKLLHGTHEGFPYPWSALRNLFAAKLGTRTKIRGVVAQRLEHLVANEKVVGSNPICPSKGVDN